MRSIFALLLIAVFLSACKKQIETREVQVPVEKKNSWTEIKRFSGIDRIFLSSGSSDKAIYLQQPFYFTELRNQDIYSGITVYGAAMPTDLRVRIPITSNFFAYPYPRYDGLLTVVNNLQPVTSPAGGYYSLKQLDSTATKIQTDYLNLFKCMAIDKNGVLLLAYENSRPDHPLTFLLLKIKTLADYPYVDTVYTRQITVPKLRNPISSYVRHIAAVNDYFLLDLSAEGIFKINEDGSYKRVSDPAIVDAFYQWKGKVYAHAEWNKVLVSENNGESWQQYNGVSDVMTTSSYHAIKDSLVAAYGDKLFTVRWEGANYFLRQLKNDGLENTTINGLEYLRASVYAATTSGLYTKSVKDFFQSK